MRALCQNLNTQYHVIYMKAMTNTIVIKKQVAMRILIFYDNPGQSSLCTPWVKALEYLGHDVKVFSQMSEMYATSRFFSLPIARRVCLWSLRKKSLQRILQAALVYAVAPILRKAQNTMNQALLETARRYNPTLVIVLKGLGIYLETLDRLRSQTGCILVNFNGDDPHNMESSNANILRAIPVYDCVLTWSQRLIHVLLNDGAKRAEYLPFGCDPDVYHAAEIIDEDRKQYSSDIVFVGSWDKEREKALEILADLNLAIWGPHWNRAGRNSVLTKHIRNGPVDMHRMAKIYGCSKVVLNMLRPQNRYSHNMRTFEIPALGGFMLATRTQQHTDLFEEGTEIALYDNFEEMRTKAIYYAAHDEERLSMVRLAHKKVVSEHRYIDRMLQLIGYLNLD